MVRVIYFICLGSCSIVFGQAVWPFEPQNVAHPICYTMGGFIYRGFHDGVDIPASVGDTAKAVITGVVRDYTPNEDSLDLQSGTIEICASVADTNTFWMYGHLYRIDTTYIGAIDSPEVATPIPTTDFYLGKVCDWPGLYGGTTDHLHLMKILELINLEHPLDSLTPSPASTPMIDTIIYRKDQSPDTLDNLSQKTPLNYVWLHDSVDIIVKAYNILEGDDHSCIEAVVYSVSDIKGNTVIPGYWLMDFGNLEYSEAGDTIKRDLVYDKGYRNDENCFTAQGNPYIVTNRDTFNVMVGALSNVKENCWPTKINKTWTANADSIEDAKFPDGLYIVKIKAEDHFEDTVIKIDTVHVDNFNPRVKQKDPPDWFAFVPTKKHKVWCIFSEAMDTTTLTIANIKIQSLKSDSFNYPITNITYIKDSFKLYLSVDSFRFKDTVQVRLLDGVKDLAGKSIGGGGKQTIAYSWTFVVGVIQLTDNDLYDVYPDVYHGKITWTQAPWGTDLGEIVLYDFYNGTLDTISPGGGIHTMPYIYKNKVAWTGRVDLDHDYIYYYNGNTAQPIALANKGHYSITINERGITWRSYKYLSSDYDSIWVEYYNFDTHYVYGLDSFVDYWGRYRGWTDIDGGELVWDHSSYPTQDNEIYRYNGGLQNFTNDPDSSDRLPDICGGQIVWIKEWGHAGYGRLWFYDGANKRRLEFTQGPVDFAQLHNGIIAWIDEPQTNRERLSIFDGRDTVELMRRITGYNFFAIPYISLHNEQVGWLRLVYETLQWPWRGYYNVSLYDGEKIIHLTIDTLGRGNSNRIEVHDGFVVYDAWDGNDYEIYLYISDTLFTPPAVVKNLKGEVIGGKSPAKKVKLTWKANTEPDLAGYKIYRSSVSYQYGTTPYATILAPEMTFIDTLPLEGMNYYVATAYDNLNNESGFSNQVSVFIDNIPPAVPADLVASYDSIAQKVSLIWRSSPDGDLKLYKVYRSEISSSYPSALDSVLKPDTTFIDSVFYLGKTYYYVVSAVDTNKNESGFSNEDTVIVPLAMYSDFALATAYNNGRKIVSSPTGDRVYCVYSSGGGIYYSYSSDSGKSFSASEIVGSPGMYPALAIDTGGNSCASWVDGSNIYYTYWTASWAPPDTILLPVVNVSPPSMVVDTTDTVHLVFTQYYWLPSDIGDLIYLKFHREHFDDAVSETLLTNTFCRTPSLTLDLSKNLHIIWEGEKCICYQEKDSTGWLGIDTIYTTATNERLYPVIDLYGTNIHTVWQNRDSLGNLDIYSRMKTDVGWDSVKKVASTVGESKFPTLAGAHYCLWQDNSSGNWEIYLSKFVDTAGIWTTPVNISNTSTASVFPHSAYALVDTASAKLYCLWTEGDTIPYSIKFQRLGVDPVAKIFVDLGQPIQSIYTLERNGYWIFGDKPYENTDWGYNTLCYRFSGLDPEKEYRLDLAYYFENQAIEGNLGQLEAIRGDKGQEEKVSGNQDISGEDIRESGEQEVRLSEACPDDKIRDGRYEPDKPDKPDKSDKPEGIGRIIQAMVVDGLPMDTVFITPNKLVRRSVWLKKESYADGEIVLEIIKIKGKRVICSEIGLYEFPCEIKKEVAGGIMGEEGLISKTFSFERIFPNPTKGLLRIRFNSPDERPITIKLYDVLGRLVDKQKLKKAKIGNNEVLLVPKDLSYGVYFMNLEADNYQKIEKVIYLK